MGTSYPPSHLCVGKCASSIQWLLKQLSSIRRGLYIMSLEAYLHQVPVLIPLLVQHQHSDHVSDTCYPDWNFPWTYPVPPSKCRVTISIGPRSILSRPFPNHRSYNHMTLYDLDTDRAVNDRKENTVVLRNLYLCICLMAVTNEALKNMKIGMEINHKYQFYMNFFLCA
jgi:hypothetical protein